MSFLFRIRDEEEHDPGLLFRTPEEDDNPLHRLLPNMPRIPRHQVFEAMVTHVDEKAVIWAVPREDVDKLAEVTAACVECGDVEREVLAGFLYVARVGRACTRVRVLRELDDGSYMSVDVDSGETMRCLKENLYKISANLNHLPPLALPLKLYGVSKTKAKLQMEDFSKAEEISGRKLGLVTVAVLEDGVQTLPLPVQVFYDRDGLKLGENLAFTMLRKGMVRVITSYNEWEAEYYDHGLEWLIGREDRLQELTFHPFPLPMRAGMWLHVSVEGLEYQMKHGEELEPTIHFGDASKVGLRVCPINGNLTFGEVSEDHEIRESLRITETQVENLCESFLNVKARLQEAAKTAAIPDWGMISVGQPVLALYNQEGFTEWCRVNLTDEETRPGKTDSVWAFFIDYGHRALVRKGDIRVLDESLAKEPVFNLEADFKMPDDSFQLKTIRSEIKDVKGEDKVKMMIQVEKIVPRAFPHTNQIIVSFSKAIEIEAGKRVGVYSIAKIC